jgi:hypothetical protein
MAFAPRKENKGIASRRNDIMDGVHTCAFLYFYIESLPASNVFGDAICSCCFNILF